MKNKVEIITIGDEILIGQIVDTNSAWMAVELNKVGFQVEQITSIHDQQSHIVKALEQALKRTDIVLITGGLGPTNDDITKKTLAQYLNTKLIFDESVLKNIEQLFANRPGFVINELTRQQAMVPEQCTIIQNLVGTAPIMWFNKDDKVIVSMPGVPYEMKYAMSNAIIPRLQQKFRTPTVIHQNAIVQGYGESALAIKIANWENQLPEDISLAYLPNNGIVKLRLSGVSENEPKLREEINTAMQQLSEILADAIFAEDDTPIEEQIGNLLRSKKMTIATAESCTGGNIAHHLTLIAGSSDYFKGSIIAYSNEIKTKILNVDAHDIDRFGAVSQQVVNQMANNTRKLLNTDIAIATSGIAGPAGGSSEKPVGTVWIAVSSESKTISREFHFGKLREDNINRATQAAILMVKEVL